MTNRICYFRAIFFVFGLFLFPPQNSDAANSLDIVISEIAWMGTVNSYNDEWIELYNNTNLPIELSGWMLKAADDTPKISLNGVIPPNSFYLLERTNDDTVPNITADQIYTGALGNNGESLSLHNNSGSVIDSVNSNGGWFAGDNELKKTVERKNLLMSGDDPNNWATSQNPGGTPKSQNSIWAETQVSPSTTPSLSSSPTPEMSVTQSPSPSSTPIPSATPEKIIYPSGVVINEILPAPIGPDETEEWIECFNQNSFEVDLSFWQISDALGKITIYTIPENTKIGPDGFLIFSRPETKITLNNDGDTISLFNPNRQVIDKITYEKAPQGQSYNRNISGRTWSNILSPGAKNVLSSAQSLLTSTETENNNQGVTNNNSDKDRDKAASLSENFPKGTFPYWPFLVASSLAIFSGFAILFLKNKIKNNKL